MTVYSIGIDERDSFLKDLLIKKIMNEKMNGLDIEEKKIGDLVFFHYIYNNQCNDRALVEIRKKLQHYIADLITGIIIDDMQAYIMEKIIQEEYFYFDKEEKDKILKDALSILRKENFVSPSENNGIEWRNRVWQRVMEHLEGNNEIILGGFIRFRLKDFLKELEDAIDCAVDDLIIEKEYNEFIKLLRYFVEIQEPKIDEVHVTIDENGKYVLHDSNFRIINNDILEDLAREISDKEISYDDLLISSLITIAPSKITIHEFNKIKNTELLNTINNVFYGKVTMSKERISPSGFFK